MKFNISQSTFRSASDSNFGDLLFVTELIQDTGETIKYRYYYNKLILEVNINHNISANFNNCSETVLEELIEISENNENITYTRSINTKLIDYSEDINEYINTINFDEELIYQSSDIKTEYLSVIKNDNGGLDEFKEEIIGFNKKYTDKLTAVSI